MRLTSIHSYARLLVALAGALLALTASVSADTARETIAKAVLEEDAEKQTAAVSTLVGNPAPEVAQLLSAWKEGSIYIYELPQSAAEDAPTTRVAIMLGGTPDGSGKQGA